MGQKWCEQISELRNIIVSLSNSNCHVSIIVFDSYSTVFCENKDPTLISTNAISCPGGGTDPRYAFASANTIMRKYVHQMGLYFVFISDGLFSHPASEISEMLKIKQQSLQYRNDFNYCSIFIGDGGSSPATMDRISNELGGTSSFVKSASQISSKFREILNLKTNTKP